MTALEVLYCLDCVFWCGRCTEQSLVGRKSVGRIASSEVCSSFRPRGKQPKEASNE